MAVSNGPWLLDTSILVDILRGYKPTRDWVDSISPADRFVSVITAAELLAGCRNQTEQRAVERELALYAMLWLDEGASQSALEWYRRFHLSHGIGFLDCLIAATAVERGLRLATLNLKHFAPLTNVHAERPH